MGQGFVLASGTISGDAAVLVKFSVNGEVLQKVDIDAVYSNSAYDSANRIVYLSNRDASVIAVYDVDTLKPARGNITVPGRHALLDMQFDSGTKSLLALSNDDQGKHFIIGRVDLATGNMTTVVTFSGDITAIPNSCDTFDDAKGVYWAGVMPSSSPSGWLPVSTRTGQLGPIVPIKEMWVQNAVWNNARQSLCGVYDDLRSIACFNVTSATTQVFAPQLNFSQYGYRQLGPAAFDESTQSYYTVFETQSEAVSWVRADLTALKPFAASIDQYFLSTMVFVPDK